MRPMAFDFVTSESQKREILIIIFSGLLDIKILHNNPPCIKVMQIFVHQIFRLDAGGSTP